MYFGSKGENTLEKILEIGLPLKTFEMLLNLVISDKFGSNKNYVDLRCRLSMESSKLAG